MARKSDATDLVRLAGRSAREPVPFGRGPGEGETLNDAQAETYWRLNKAGSIDPTAALGSAAHPWYDRPGGPRPKDGDWFVDLDGGHRQQGGAPALTPEQLQAAQAQTDAKQWVAMLPSPLRAVRQGASYNLGDELDAGFVGASTGLWNAWQRINDREVPYSAAQAARAVLDANRLSAARYAQDHPVANFALESAGSLAAPGGQELRAYLAAREGAPVVAQGLMKAAPRFWTEVKAGALQGFARGAGKAEGIGPDRLNGGLVGAGKGAALSSLRLVGQTALPMVASSLGQAGQPTVFLDGTTPQAAQLARAAELGLPIQGPAYMRPPPTVRPFKPVNPSTDTPLSRLYRNPRIAALEGRASARRNAKSAPYPLPGILDP